jgi:VIT1/CCC1 family predicted Fe2+/Mn2+ transporter
MSMNHTADPRTVPQLLSDLAREISTLFRKEGQLIRAELSEKASQLQVGIGSAAAGAIILLVALNVLAAALVAALANLVGAGWAALIVGVVLAVIGAILVKKGMSDMSHLAPERTVSQVSQDANLVKEQVR